MSNMRLKYRIPLAIIAIMMVVTLSIGSSYALWKVTKEQDVANIITTGCFEVSFIEESNSINLTNTFPITDEKGLTTTPYVFTVKNTCTIDADYTIYLNTLNLTNGKAKIADNLIKYSIVQNGIVENNNVALLNTAPIENDKALFSVTDFDATSAIDTSYKLASGTLRASSSKEAGDGESATFSLRLWIDSSATTAINGQVFEGAVYSIARTSSKK